MSLAESCQSLRTPPSPLRLRRLALGLRQVDVAELAGLSREQIVRLEAGDCTPGWGTVQRLAAALQASPEVLFPLNDEAPAGNGRQVTATDDGDVGDGSEA
ncbi:MAG TPA: helix-turn-helix transcriptional regulator [Solirubrobacteraceae bacterium]|nr:helix-turn-helix transcriptional regulator [Solirubrobacteraceae bacterium]